jgi:ketosteroid isomerase-like protein
MTKARAALAIFGFLVGITPGVAFGQLQEQSAEEAVQKFVDQTIDYVKTQQGTKFADQYDPDLTASKDGRWIADTEAYVTGFGEAISEIRVHAFSWIHRQVYVLAPDAAVFVGLANVSASFGSSDERLKYDFAWTLLLKEKNGNWMIVHEHTSHLWHEPAAEQ